MNIVILDYITLGEDLDLSPASRFGNVIKYPTSTQDEAKIRVKDADIIIVNKVKMVEDVLVNAPNLKLICETAEGCQYKTPPTSCEAYAIVLHKMKKRYPNAKIYFQTVYNPYKGMNVALKSVTEQLKLDDYGERSVASLNAPIEALADELGYEIVPVWTEFEESGKDLVNAGISLLPFNISVDPHPNWQGHELIAKIYYDIITEAK